MNFLNVLKDAAPGILSSFAGGGASGLSQGLGGLASGILSRFIPGFKGMGQAQGEDEEAPWNRFRSRKRNRPGALSSGSLDLSMKA